MSKKMLKRSLALGALMAFVITGSAYAYDKVTGVTYQDGAVNSITAVTSISVNTSELNNNEKLIGVYTVNNTEVKFNNDFSLAVSGGEDYDEVGSSTPSRHLSGVVVEYGQNIFKGNETKINVTNAGNPNEVHLATANNDTAVAVIDFAAANTVLTYNGTGDSEILGVYSSGAGSEVKFTGATAKIDIKSTGATNKDVYGAFVSYSGELTSAANNDLTVNVEANSSTNVYGINAPKWGGAIGTVDLDGALTVAVTNEGSGNAYGVSGSDGSTINLANTTITATSNGGKAYGIYADASNVNVTGDLTVNATGGLIARGLESRNGSHIIVGNADKTTNVTINTASTSSAADDFVIGAFARHNGSTININADEVNITATSTGEAEALGTCANTTTVAGVAGIEIDANKTVITAKASKNGYASAIATFSGSKTVINGDLEANGDNAIYTRGNAKTYINANEETYASLGKNVVLNGNISFGKGYPQETEVIDATVVVNFDGENSEFNGAVVASALDKTVDKNLNSKVTTGATLGFYNGAKWNLKGESIVNGVTFGAGSVLNLENGNLYDDAQSGAYALDGTYTNGELKVVEGAKLQIGNIKETTYNIAQGFAEPTNKWTLDDALMELDVEKGVDGWIYENNNLQVAVKAKDTEQMAADTGMSESTAGMVSGIINAANGSTTYEEGSSEKAAIDFIQNVAKEHGSDSAAVGEAINSATKMAEAGGNSATAANIVKNVTGVTNDRLSFNCGHSAPHKGGHGVGLFEEGSGADVWVEYVHGKDKVEDMPSSAGATSYEGQFNGFVMGVDFKKVNKFQSGIAFNYGEGDTNSVGSAARTHSDYDFWGVGYYGNIHNDDSNVIFDINYAKTDSDVTQNNSTTVFEASPETTTWTAGVKVEKLYQNENVQIVPYTGLRYMSIDSDDYSTKCGAFNYSMERQDIWLLPLGVSIRQEIANDNGWTVSPRVDLSYIWAFGDTNSNMEVKSPFSGVSQLGYDVMDDGSVLGLVGIEAHKGQWGFGVSYSYQKGDHSESKKWFIDANYSF